MRTVDSKHYLPQSLEGNSGDPKKATLKNSNITPTVFVIKMAISKDASYL